MPVTENEFYVCPICKGALGKQNQCLTCSSCARSYPIQDTIPDFLLEKLSTSQDAVLRRMNAIDKMAGIYETQLWYPAVLAVFGGWKSRSLSKLIAKVTGKLGAIKGRVLDVACGPGTYGRHAAGPSRDLFGIDISLGMLRQGVIYSAQEKIENIRFARARVEALPFENGFFDAALCCGSLHLFSDTQAALTETARVMKPGALLSVFTFTAGDAGILKYPKVRRWFRKKHGLHVFELNPLEQVLGQSGFDSFQPEVTGSILTFTARRRA